MIKLTTLFLLVGFLHVSGNGIAQEVTLKDKSISLKEVFREVKKQTGYNFLWAAKNVKDDRRISIDLKAEPLTTALPQLLKGLPLTYMIKEKTILIKEKPLAVESIPVKSMRKSDRQQSELVLVYPEVRGLVVDILGNPLAGASVKIKASSITTTTNQAGTFVLYDVPENSLLEVSFVGYINEEFKVSADMGTLVLEAVMSELDEVVVVGYGTMRKQHVTGAIGTVKMNDDLAYRPSGEFGQALYGSIAGVQVINTSGRPGQSSTIQVRGANSIGADATPLIVIDGIILPDFDLSTINPADIESVSVLKDAASAAIYGSRGSNGVILVTTKTGVVGKPRFSINHSSSLQSVVRRIDVMNSAEYAQAAIDAAQNGWIDNGGDPNAPNTIEARNEIKYTWPIPLNNPESLYDTDWHDVVFRTAPMHKVDLGLIGGDENTSYRLSAGIFTQEGILINTDYKKYSLNSKIDSKVSSWLKVGGMLNVNLDYENRAGNTTVHTLTSANQYLPVYPVYGEDGYLGGPQNTPGFENHVNVLFRVHHGHPYHRGGGGELLDIQRLNTLGNLYGEITILPGLTYKSSFNAFIRRSEQKHYINANTGQDPTVLRQASTSVSTGEILNYSALNNLSYNNNWNGHGFEAVAGYEFNQSKFYGFEAQRRDYDNDFIPYLSGGKTIYGANDDAYENALISGFGRVSYNYENKYMFSSTFRRDGSSRFGPSHKWGNFWSISAGWRLSEEDFIKEIDFISDLNIRTSYGFTGNQSIGDYGWISPMSQSRVALGNNTLVSYYPSRLENPELQWERTKQQNIGIDLGLLNNRIYFEADYYMSISDDLLLDVPIPSLTGFNSVLQNIGELKNNGVELKITSHILKSELNWTSFLTFSANRNKVSALGPDNSPLYYNPGSAMTSINAIGAPLFSYYGLVYDGVYMSQDEIDADPASYSKVKPGDRRYKDKNGDGVIDANDRAIIGSNQPDFIWALSNSFRYKNLDFSFLIQGVQGVDVFDENIHRSWMYHEGRNYHRELLNRWRSEEQPGNGYIPKLSVDLAEFDLTPSSYFIQDGSYLRLQEVTLGYQVPANFINKLGSGMNARIYYNGTNLLLLSNATVYDPENFKSSPSDVSSRGSNFSAYPSARTHTFGINVAF